MNQNNQTRGNKFSNTSLSQGQEERNRTPDPKKVNFDPSITQGNKKNSTSNLPTKSPAKSPGKNINPSLKNSKKDQDIGYTLDNDLGGNKGLSRDKSSRYEFASDLHSMSKTLSGE
jgi:hypothetical protein